MFFTDDFENAKEPTEVTSYDTPSTSIKLGTITLSNA